MHSLIVAMVILFEEASHFFLQVFHCGGKITIEIIATLTMGFMIMVMVGISIKIPKITCYCLILPDYLCVLHGLKICSLRLFLKLDQLEVVHLPPDFVFKLVKNNKLEFTDDILVVPIHYDLPVFSPDEVSLSK